MMESLRCDTPAPADRAELYELLVAELTDFAVFLMDPDGCLTSWNPGVERLLGYPEAEWLGRPVHSIFTPEDRAARKPEEEMSKAVRDGRAPDNRWHQRKDGSRLFVEGTMVALKDPRGKLLGFSKVIRDVTARQQSDETLQASEARFRLMADAVPQIVWITDAEGRMEFFNRQWRAYTGAPKEPKTAAEMAALFVHPDDRTATMEAFHEAWRSGSTFEVEHRIRSADRTYRWFLVRAEPYRNPATQEIMRWFGTSTDIHDRKQAEAAQHASEERFRALVDASSEVLYRMSPDWTEMHQLSGGEFLLDTGSPNKNWLQEYIHPEDQPHVLETIQQAVRTKSVFELEHRVRRVDGCLGWTHSRAVPLCDTNGAIIEWFGAASDITARKVAEAERERLLQQIEAERQRLEQVFAQAPVAVVVFRGRDFVVELANPLYQALLPGRELVGRRFAEVMPELGQEVWDVFHRVLDTGEPFIANEWLIPYDANRNGVLEDHWFNVVYHPFREPDGRVSGFIAVLTDVTLQVLARQELERVNRGLEEFAYVASHDLQEPLRMVHSHSQLLVRRLGDGLTDEQREFVGFIQQGVQRMEKLIKDLLSYSRTIHTVGEVAASQASLEEALCHALKAVQTHAAETGAAILHEFLPTVRGDVTQLSHVFQNLLSNALKYRKPGERPTVHISARQEGSEWVISVRDNGIGFDPAHAERIFGLFKRLHHGDEYPGTGLGLAICRRIVERYGGRMWAESEPGAGATFFFSLPAMP